MLLNSSPDRAEGCRLDLGQDQIWVDGVPWPVIIKRRRGATRLTLTADRTGHLTLKCAERSRADHLLAFVAQHRTWLLTRVRKVVPGVPFADGVEVPILGTPVRLVHDPSHRRPARRVDDRLEVGGDADFLASRVERYLIGLARETIPPRARALAARVDRQPNAIRVKDTRTRWGSCSSRGNLNFSWRLILAPEAVLDYVIAHEVAHLVHLDHSARFWRACAALVAGGEAEMDRQRAWLRRHGSSLHRYGVRVAAPPPAAEIHAAIAG